MNLGELPPCVHAPLGCGTAPPPLKVGPCFSVPSIWVSVICLDQSNMEDVTLGKLWSLKDPDSSGCCSPGALRPPGWEDAWSREAVSRRLSCPG